MKKQYVDVICLHDSQGYVKPLTVIWKNGMRYAVDKIMQVVPAASLKSGGVGIRYTCRIQNQYRYLFLEDNKWFVEKMQG